MFRGELRSILNLTTFYLARAHHREGHPIPRNTMKTLHEREKESKGFSRIRLEVVVRALIVFSLMISL